jgi:hypothetical protein
VEEKPLIDQKGNGMSLGQSLIVVKCNCKEAPINLII